MSAPYFSFSRARSSPAPFTFLLAGSRFKHYRAKWQTPKNIDPATYTCQGCVYSAEPDSAFIADSTEISNMGDPRKLVLETDEEPIIEEAPGE